MYKNNYSIDYFVRPGEFLASRQTFEPGESRVFELYYFVLMQIAVFCWRFLDITSYNEIFKKNNDDELIGVGYLQMGHVFESLTKDYKF